MEEDNPENATKTQLYVVRTRIKTKFAISFEGFFSSLLQSIYGKYIKKNSARSELSFFLVYIIYFCFLPTSMAEAS